MEWTEIKAFVASEVVEAVSNIFIESGASGVAIEDELDIDNYVLDPFGEIADKEQLKTIRGGASVAAYFPETIFLPEILPNIQERIKELENFGLDIGENRLEVSEVNEESWADAWKKYYSPKRLTRFLTVVPSWEKYEPVVEDERLIVLDPGMAFGTGTHPTTKLTLQALEYTIRGGETLLDVGTGSGVLSIAAALLGVTEIHAFDLDEVAVNRAKENMALNPIAKNVQVSVGDLLKGVEIKADIIVANILADIIVLMLEDAARLLKENGYLIVSGIIQDKLPMVQESLQASGFSVEQMMTQGEWVAMVLKKADEDNDHTIVGG